MVGQGPLEACSGMSAWDAEVLRTASAIVELAGGQHA